MSIAVSEIALHVLMLEVFQEFSRRYPGIRIQIFNHSSNEGADAVSRGTAELAVISSPFTASAALRETELLSVQDILIAGNRFADLKHRTLSLSDLSHYPLIGLAPHTGTYVFFKKLFESHGLVYQTPVEAATTDQVLPLVAHDIGLGFLPRRLAEPAMESGDVFELSLKESVPLRHISLVRDRSRPLSAAAETLAEVTETIAKQKRI